MDALERLVVIKTIRCCLYVLQEDWGGIEPNSGEASAWVERLISNTHEPPPPLASTPRTHTQSPTFPLSIPRQERTERASSQHMCITSLLCVAADDDVAGDQLWYVLTTWGHQPTSITCLILTFTSQTLYTPSCGVGW